MAKVRKQRFRRQERRSRPIIQAEFCHIIIARPGDRLSAGMIEAARNWHRKRWQQWKYAPCATCEHGLYLPDESTVAGLVFKVPLHNARSLGVGCLCPRCATLFDRLLVQRISDRVGLRAVAVSAVVAGAAGHA